LALTGVGRVAGRIRQDLQSCDQAAVEQALCIAGARRMRARGGSQALHVANFFNGDGCDRREPFLARGAQGSFAHGARQSGEIVGRERQKQFILAGEIAIERSGRKASLGCDASQRQFARAAACRNPARRVEDSRSGAGMRLRAAQNSLLCHVRHDTNISDSPAKPETKVEIRIEKTAPTARSRSNATHLGGVSR